MRRREFIRHFSSTVVAWPLTARAQQPDRLRLVGVLMAYAESDSTAQSWLATFRAALAKLGWTEGSNAASGREADPRQTPITTPNSNLPP
jgi:putative tryptophan/tyrosine transport system substrate-binding protein